MAMRHYPERIMDRFWSKVDKSGECWNWTGSKVNSGYGQFTPSPERGSMLAHRFIYEHEVGEIPKGMVVMHSCDNKSCVRPSHLAKGTQSDNVADMRSKNRHVNPPLIIGSCHHSSVLTEDQVHEIRSRRRSGENGKTLAKVFGVSDSMIYDIANGKKWKHLPERGS